ncbi:MAG: hypothetical protein U0441_23455 [Polyangiaceae bacterium]
MLRLFSALRSFAGHDDPRSAYEAETRAIADVLETPTVDPRFRAEMASLRGRPETIVLGSAQRDASVPVGAPLRELAGAGHALVLGGTGAGKTRVVAGIIQQLLRRLAQGASSPGLWVVDHKSELVGLVREILAGLVGELPSAQSARLLDKLVVLNPFSDWLVPMQILRPEAGVAPQVQAFEVTSLIDRLGGAELGVRQDSFLFHLILLGISKRLSLPHVAALLANPNELAAAAASSPISEVQAYFSGTNRLSQSSMEGVAARLHRLLRLPSTRLMLGAGDTVSFRRLLADGCIVLVDVGSPPMGCEDLGRFWAGLATLKLVRAIFERTHAEATRPVTIFVDEWQEGLLGGGDIAENYERVLSMARSRGVSFCLISQSLAGAAKVSSSLPKVVATNTNLQLLFRASEEDARAMTHLLPITGRRPRESMLPWEERRGSPFLSRNEELASLQEEVVRLPNRVFYFWDRTRPYPAELVHALYVAPGPAPRGDRALEQRLLAGTLARPVVQLEREERQARLVVFRSTTPMPPEPRLPPRRPRQRGRS